MTNIYNSCPDLTAYRTQVIAARVTDEGRHLVLLAENILRPAGGGQPQDYGRFQCGDLEGAIGAILKSHGDTWIEIDSPVSKLPVIGDSIKIEIDVARRRAMSRCHSLTHLGMAAIKQILLGYESKGAEIAETGRSVVLRFRGAHVPDVALLNEVDCRMRSLIAKCIPIHVEKAKSVDAAARAYGCWRVDPDNNLTGRIRVVHIEGVDANPCSGSHVRNTGEIGPFRMGACRGDERGVTELCIERLDELVVNRTEKHRQDGPDGNRRHYL